MDKLARSLPLHLTAVLIFSSRDGVFKYMICGICLLHSLCDLDPRLPKFDQIFLHDVKMVEQLIDLVFYMLITLSTYRQDDHAFCFMNLSHSALVACSLHLLTGFISTQWQDITNILLAHPKVDIFMDAAFGSVRVVVRSLETTLIACYKDSSAESNLSAEQVVYFLCQQCEASLQFIFSLCQQKLFMERLLKNKTKVLTAVISLSHVDFLSSWCSSNLSETEDDASIEYDVFATVEWIMDNSSSMDLQNSTVLELHLISNTMPSASYAHHRTSLLVKIIANLHCFVPSHCEEHERNLFIQKVLECPKIDLSNLLPGFSFTSDAPKAATVSKNLRSLLSHAESLMPKFLEAEDVQLLRVFFGQIQALFSSSGFWENRVQEAQSIGIPSSLLQVKEPAELDKKVGNLKEGMSENSSFPCIGQYNTRVENTNLGDDLNRQLQVEGNGMASKTVVRGARDMDKDAQNAETSGSDTSSAKGKNVLDHVDNGESKSMERHRKVVVVDTPEDEKVETVQRRKRKRTIMNDKMVTLIEKALLDEPEMQRNATALQSWADKLSNLGSEITPSQLKNWLNNRKAKLARTRTPKDSPVPDKQKGPVGVSSDSPDNLGPLDIVRCNVGQRAVLVNVRGEEIGKGKVVQVSGKWYGKSLEELGTYVMDVYELHADKGMRLPYTSEATGTSFAEAEKKLGGMRVLWDSRRILVLQSE